MQTETKICASCGRTMEYRKKWAKNWDQVRYCSDECRRNKSKHDYRAQIMALLDKRAAGLTACPSEVLPLEQKTDKEMMEHVRRSARQLADEGLIEIVQKGQVIDPTKIRGPIRLRKK